MTAPVVNPATDKQIAFLTKLIGDKGLTIDIPTEMTTKEASALIDQALEAPKAKKGVSLVKKAPVSLIKTPTPAAMVADVVTDPAKRDAVIEALEAAIAVLRTL